MERLQTGQDRSSTSKVRRLNTVPAGQRYAMFMPSYFSILSRFNAKKPSPYHHDMPGKTILAFSRIVHLFDYMVGQFSKLYFARDKMKLLSPSGTSEVAQATSTRRFAHAQAGV